MSELSEQSDNQQEWATAPGVMLSAELGPFGLTVTAENYTEDDEGLYHASEGVLRVFNQETGEDVLNETVTPIFGAEFTDWDKGFIYDKADAALLAAGYDPDALAAQDNAA